MKQFKQFVEASFNFNHDEKKSKEITSIAKKLTLLSPAEKKVLDAFIKDTSKSSSELEDILVAHSKMKHDSDQKELIRQMRAKLR
tara:strand:- start:239 stop:493 length:255 start_codon:yes stop_codon:yes gene_type:complete